MTVRLRLKRTGNKNSPCWRVVVADSKAPRDGRHIEEIGFYNPTKTPTELKLDLDRVDHWVKVGAQPTEQVASLIKRAKVASAS